eukprot:TRINITY_DN2562_c0_g1_i23.p1 TRINITY_DN2562_c0_g1~~TRINITY_DN2562_c0_g1_i23.p1  ORF type:complete len:1638 (+),score=290.27 TRINITY_DN2562_c0_g1_i23:62-4975(+)
MATQGSVREDLLRARFSVRLVDIDYYLSPPIDGLDTKSCSWTGNPIKEVPIIRIFGSTPKGQRCCCHVHHVFPYLLIPYPTEVRGSSRKEIEEFLYQTALSVEAALELSLQQKDSESEKKALEKQKTGPKDELPTMHNNTYHSKPTRDKKQQKKGQYVYRVGICKARSIYGFHEDQGTFVKIHLFNPGLISRLTLLLQQGVIMGEKFDVYEGHIPYILQFMIDYNLFGMAYVNLRDVRFRQPLQKPVSYSTTRHNNIASQITQSMASSQFWNEHTIEESMRLDESVATRESSCELECDLLSEDILNRNLICRSPLQAQDDKKLVQSLALIWEDEKERRKGVNKSTQMTPTSSPARPPKLPFRRVTQHADHFRRILQQVTCLDSTINSESTAMQADKSHTLLENPIPEESITINYDTTQLYSEHHTPIVDEAVLSQTKENDVIAILDWMQERDAADQIELDQREEEELHFDDDGQPDEYIEALPVDDMEKPVHLQSDSPIPQYDGHHDMSRSKKTNAKGTTRQSKPTASKGPSAGAEANQPKLKRKVYCSLFGQEGVEKKKRLPSDSKKTLQDALDESISSFEKSFTKHAQDVEDIISVFTEFPPTKHEASVPSTSKKADSSHSPCLSVSLMDEVYSPPKVQPDNVTPSRDFCLELHLQDSLGTVIQETPLPTNESQQPRILTQQRPISKLSLSRRLFLDTNPENDPPINGQVAFEYTYRPPPPSPNALLQYIEKHKLPRIPYKDPFYSVQEDVPKKPVTSGPYEFDNRYDGKATLCEFETSFSAFHKRISSREKYSYEYVPQAPTRKEATQWLKLTASLKTQLACEVSMQVDERPARIEDGRQNTASTPPLADPTILKSKDGFRTPQKPIQPSRASRKSPQQETSPGGSKLLLESPLGPSVRSGIEGPSVPTRSPLALREARVLKENAIINSTQNLRCLVLECLCSTREAMKPDPKKDPILAIVFCIRDLDIYEASQGEDFGTQPNNGDTYGILTLSKQMPKLGFDHIAFEHYFIDESAMIARFIDIVSSCDPDVVLGYEIQSSSLGYLIDRGAELNYDMVSKLGRVQTRPIKFENRHDEWGLRNSSGIHLVGRIVLNLWRLVRFEYRIAVKTFEGSVWEILGKRVPYYSESTLSKWFQSDAHHQWRSLQHYITKCNFTLELLDKMNLVSKTSEFARVYGIDFFSVLSRGSQYKVESMMIRLGKPQNYVFFSPSKQQVANQSSIECLPLVMEPESRFYTSPVVVLDFQSLYPSIVIAYNYCYSTCLGKVSIDEEKKFGAGRLKVPHRLLKKVQDHVKPSPNGVLYADASVRCGILPRLLKEILDTRIMVKRAMKTVKDDKLLYRMMDARQLGLKMIANVTYGYTSASYSGRMPCAEVADSIVQTARETLEEAIRVVESEWNAKVVYGDTDSLFVLLPGATREDAFRIGKEISDRITSINPSPMKLNFDKVYHPCFLVTKKRYVGAKFESPSQVEFQLEAKGIETIRRDTCPAVAKIMEKALRIFFKNPDLSQVKVYLERQFAKICTQRVSVEDFIFAKEVRMGTYTPGYLPPAAVVSSKLMEKDHRAEPKYAERVPYVVVSGAPGSRLMDLVVEPQDLLNESKGYRLNATYYITKQIIPSLDRLFGLARNLHMTSFD